MKNWGATGKVLSIRQDIMRQVFRPNFKVLSVDSVQRDRGT